MAENGCSHSQGFIYVKYSCVTCNSIVERLLLNLLIELELLFAVLTASFSD